MQFESKGLGARRPCFFLARHVIFLVRSLHVSGVTFPLCLHRQGLLFFSPIPEEPPLSVTLHFLHHRPIAPHPLFYYYCYLLITCQSTFDYEINIIITPK